MLTSNNFLVIFGLTVLIAVSVNGDRSIGRGRGKPSRANCRRCVEELRPMNVRKDQITLSGFSSGGTMAQIMQFAYSSAIQGIAVFSHTFLRCGPPNGSFQDWDRVCTNLDNATESQYYNTDLVHKDIQNYFEKGYIEDPRNLENKRLYVYTGLRNQFFAPVQALNILKVYERYIKNQYRIKTRVQDSTLVMPTDNNYGKACTEDTSDTWFIGNCGFSGAFDALKFLYEDDFQVICPKSYHEPLQLQPLRLFNQKPFLKGIENHQMDDIGFMYIPSGCQYGAPCPLHVFFHGCWNNRNVSGTAFIENSGFMEVAEANGIIMLFPQNNPVQLYNTDARGCWDTFGVGGELYATQKGPQVRAVRRIISAMVGNRPRNNNYYD